MKRVLIGVLAVVCTVAVGSYAPAGELGLNATICGKCHEEESNKMMGFLKNISYRSGTILMDLLTHKEVVRFDEETRIKNVASLEEIKNYKGKGFRIYFAEEDDGAKYAVHITRFDILQLVEDKDKLSRQDVLELMARERKPVFVDVRPVPHYKAAHIPGAVNVPAPAFEKFKNNLPADKSTPIVIYGVGGCLSPSVAVNAMAMGYEDVRVYTAGFPDWSRFHYTVTTPGFVKKNLADHGVVVIDVRPPAEVAKGHISGVVSWPLAELDGLRSVLPEKKNAPIVLFGTGSDKAAATIISWGYRGVRVLPGDLEAWRKSGGAVSSGAASRQVVYVPKAQPGVILPDAFRKLVGEAGKGVTLVDVRHEDEFREGHVPGSINIPVDDLEEELDSLNRDDEIILYCNSGARAEMAYNLLKNEGYKVRYLDAMVKAKADNSFSIEEK